MRLNTRQPRPRKRPLSIAQQPRWFDAQKEVAAAIILDDPAKHSAFQVSWAKQFRQRCASEDAIHGGQR